MTDANPITALSGSLRFFDLPPELRDIVYNELWRTTPKLRKHAVLHDGTRNTLRLVAAHRDVQNILDDQIVLSTVPDWCTTNKNFHKEAMAEFYSNCQWVASAPGTGVATPFMLCAGCPNRENKMLEIVRHHLRHDIPAAANPPQKLRIGVRRSSVWPTGLSLLIEMECSLRDKDGVKMLVVSFEIVLKMISEGVVRLEVDLEDFEETRFSLDRLVVQLPTVAAEDHGLGDEADLVYDLVEIEVRRLASVLVEASTRIDSSLESWVSKGEDYGCWKFTVQKR
ncbi:hypothetical protein N0V86_006674 [Didymella sp. IMI 355093]|nr:hypothetical protein N0V86_006674 [Didymella sp. IMI 355093]